MYKSLTVGLSEGLKVGLRVGLRVGARVGLNEGESVGESCQLKKSKNNNACMLCLDIMVYSGRWFTKTK